MSRTIIGAAAQASVVLTNRAGEPADADGAVTVTVSRDDGTALLTDAATSHDAADTGVYTVDLDPDDLGDQVDVLQLVWSATVDGVDVTETTWLEVMGGRLFTRKQLRGQRGLSSAASFPDVDLDDIHDEVQDIIQSATGVSWVPRFAHDRMPGNGRPSIALSHLRPRQLILVRYTDTDGTVETVDHTGWELTDGGILTRTDGGTFLAGTWDIRYEHGFDRPHTDIHKGALAAARVLLLEDHNDITDRATSITNEFGNVRISQPGEGRPFGIPAVDERIMRRSHKSAVQVG